MENASDHGYRLRAFHSAAFGSSNDGIVPSPDTIFHRAESFTVTSLEYRDNPHIIALCPSNHSLCSLSLKISKKTTDFQYQSKNEQRQRTTQQDTEHNSLIDCLSDVWTRYPVVPAVRRYADVFQSSTLA